MAPFQLSPQQLARYQQDGYLLVPDLFTPQEVGLLHRIAKADRAIASAGSMADGAGGASKIWLTVELKQDIYSAYSHCQRIVGPLGQIFNDEVYFYHHKMMLKEPLVGGAWEWHQDYGYWYNDGFLFPDMASCMIAVDRATRDNGCLQVLRGSHHLGRIEHGRVGSQTGANPERVEQAAKQLELVYCEMQPGTALFFHSNLLHRSDQNRSPNSRWSLICCYTAGHNRSALEEKRPYSRCKKIEPWENSYILEVGQSHLAAIEAAAKQPASATQS